MSHLVTSVIEFLTKIILGQRDTLRPVFIQPSMVAGVDDMLGLWLVILL